MRDIRRNGAKGDGSPSLFFMPLNQPEEFYIMQTMGMIRTFIALEIPDEHKQEVDKLIVKLKPFGPDVRWVRAANLHFTLRFLGDIYESSVEKLNDAITSSIADIKPIELKLSGLGCFPNMKRPRVVWLGAAGEIDELKVLANNVESACRESDFGKGDKPFSPHLTIGRIKNPHGLGMLIERLPKVEFSSDDILVDHVTIFKSDLSPRGPKYTSLAEIKLTE